MKDFIIPIKERKRIRDEKIRSLHAQHYSQNEIVAEMSKLGMGVSKTTVFFAIKGRSKKKSGDKNNITSK